MYFFFVPFFAAGQRLHRHVRAHHPTKTITDVVFLLSFVFLPVPQGFIVVGGPVSRGTFENQRKKYAENMYRKSRRSKAILWPQQMYTKPQDQTAKMA